MCRNPPGGIMPVVSTRRERRVGLVRRKLLCRRRKKNKALVRRFVEELDKGNLDVIDELLAPDFVDLSLLPG
jgi:hypothetical protein